jgi:hypothetical protein
VKKRKCRRVSGSLCAFSLKKKKKKKYLDALGVVGPPKGKKGNFFEYLPNHWNDRKSLLPLRGY